MRQDIKSHRQQAWAEAFGIWCLFNLPQFITISFTTFLQLDKCRKQNTLPSICFYARLSFWPTAAHAQVFMARSWTPDPWDPETLRLRLTTPHCSCLAQQLNAIIESIRWQKCSSTPAIYVRFIDRKSRVLTAGADDFTTCWNANQDERALVPPSRPRLLFRIRSDRMWFKCSLVKPSLSRLLEHWAVKGL